MIIDHPRDIEEFKKLYDERPMNDGLYSFKHILNNPNLFCFYDEITAKLKGFIFINADKEKRLYLSGVSTKKIMADVITAIITICNAFKEDMYSETDKKEAALVLRKAGFKKISTNKYKRSRNNG